MQDKPSCKTKSSGATHKRVKGLGRRPAFGNGTQGKFAIDKQYYAVAKALDATQNPTQVSNDSSALLNTDMVRRFDPHLENHIKVTQFQI